MQEKFRKISHLILNVFLVVESGLYYCCFSDEVGVQKPYGLVRLVASKHLIRYLIFVGTISSSSFFLDLIMLHMKFLYPLQRWNTIP